MSGYALRDKPAKSAIHPLWVKAVALQDRRGSLAVIVGFDIIGFPRKFAKRIKLRVRNRLNISLDKILLNCTHTHSEPVIADSLIGIYPLEGTDQIERINRYSKHLQEKIIETIKEAVSKLRPVKLYYGKGISRFAVNRRNNNPRKMRP